MHSKGLTTAVVLLLLAASGSVAAQNPTTERARDAARAREEALRPEHRPRKLPDDIFKPSEEVGEDYPVPFPVDI